MDKPRASSLPLSSSPLLSSSPSLPLISASISPPSKPPRSKTSSLQKIESLELRIGNLKFALCALLVSTLDECYQAGGSKDKARDFAKSILQEEESVEESVYSRGGYSL